MVRRMRSASTPYVLIVVLLSVHGPIFRSQQFRLPLCINITILYRLYAPPPPHNILGRLCSGTLLLDLADSQTAVVVVIVGSSSSSFAVWVWVAATTFYALLCRSLMPWMRFSIRALAYDVERLREILYAAHSGHTYSHMCGSYSCTSAPCICKRSGHIYWYICNARRSMCCATMHARFLH